MCGDRWRWRWRGEGEEGRPGRVLRRRRARQPACMCACVHACVCASHAARGAIALRLAAATSEGRVAPIALGGGRVEAVGERAVGGGWPRGRAARRARGVRWSTVRIRSLVHARVSTGRAGGRKGPQGIALGLDPIAWDLSWAAGHASRCGRATCVFGRRRTRTRRGRGRGKWNQGIGMRIARCYEMTREMGR